MSYVKQRGVTIKSKEAQLTDPCVIGSLQQ